MVKREKMVKNEKQSSERVGQNGRLFLFCLLVSFIFITICSKNSFLYPLQDWVDVQCFFTTGKAIVSGPDTAVLYRDIMEQKGPLLYFLFGGAYLLFGNTFFGVYLMELLSFSAFLYYSAKCLLLYTDKRIWVMLSTAFLAFSVSTSRSFCYGGGAEELCLVCFSYTLYLFLCFFSSDDVKKWEWYGTGLCMGAVFWIKYSMTGLYVAAFLFLAVFLVRRKEVRHLAEIYLFAFLGFLSVTLPILLYFTVNGALYDLWHVYFYSNIFQYGGTPSGGILGIARRTLSHVKALLLNGVLYTAAAMLGGIYLLQKRDTKSWFLIVCALAEGGFLCLGSVFQKYYGLPMAAFSWIGYYAIIAFLTRVREAVRRTPKVVLGLAVFCLAVISYFVSDNTYLIGEKRENLPQYQFAEIIHQKEDATILNYNFLDGGFYYAADVLPCTKYFCCLNLQSDDMIRELDSYILEQRTDFVITRGMRLEDRFSELRYRLVDTAEYYLEGQNREYRLYEKCK